MNIEMKMDCICVGRTEKKSPDGKNTYYSVSVSLPSGEAGTLSCNEETYKEIANFKPYTLKVVYRDGQYKGLRVVGIVGDSTDPTFRNMFGLPPLEDGTSKKK